MRWVDMKFLNSVPQHLWDSPEEPERSGWGIESGSQGPDSKVKEDNSAYTYFIYWVYVGDFV